MNRIREVLINRIETNGGYHRHHQQSCALEWTVSFTPDLDIDHIYALTKDERPLPDSIRKAWNADQRWEMYQEQVANGLDGDDVYRTYSPETAARWGLPYLNIDRPVTERYARMTGNECAYYPAKIKGWRLNKPFSALAFNVTFELSGRGGKHICVTEFEGQSLCGDREDLLQAIREGDGGEVFGLTHRHTYSNQWCVKLLAMMDEWDKMFNSTAADEEGEYLATEDLQRELDEYYEEHAEAQHWAERDVVTEA